MRILLYNLTGICWVTLIYKYYSHWFTCNNLILKTTTYSLAYFFSSVTLPFVDIPAVRLKKRKISSMCHADYTCASHIHIYNNKKLTFQGQGNMVYWRFCWKWKKIWTRKYKKQKKWKTEILNYWKTVYSSENFLVQWWMVLILPLRIHIWLE